MKRNSIIKSIALSITLSVVLAGCGGSPSISKDNVVKKEIVKDDISLLTINRTVTDSNLNDGDIIKFEKGMSFFDFYPKMSGYEETKLGENALEIKEYYFKDNNFEEYDVYSDEKNSYILKSGNWTQEDKKNSLSYVIDDNGVLTLTQRGYRVTILNQEDISQQERLSVFMPEGSFVSVLQVEQLEDQYRLFDEVTDGTGYYNSISEYVKIQCEAENYKGADGTSCDESTTKGETKEGKWSIKTVDNVEILEEKNDYDYKNGYASIFALKGETLYAGGVDFKGVGTRLYVNDIAMNAYKETLTGEKPPVVIPPVSPIENIAKGKEIYTAKNCAGCHGANADVEGHGAKALITYSKDTITKLLKGYKYDDLNQYGEGSTMQGQVASLSDEDIEKVAQYIESLETPVVAPPVEDEEPVVIVDPPAEDNGDALKGESLYKANCASCHGAKGGTSALGSGAIISNKSFSQIVDLLKGYKDGTLNQYAQGSLMQGYAKNLSDKDMENIAKYIKSL